MNISRQDVDALNAILTVEIAPADYSEKVTKTLEDYRKKASIPGFRKGHVPAGLVKKQFGKGIMIDEVNHLLQHGVNDYLRDNQVDILGNPLPVPQNNIKWEEGETFSFQFELGLTPNFDFKLPKDKINYYKIVADDSMINDYVTDLQRRYGAVSQPDKSEATDVLFGTFTQVDAQDLAVEGGFTKRGSLRLETVKEKGLLKQLTGIEKGTTVAFNAKEALEDTVSLTSLLGLNEEELAAFDGHVRFEVENINRLTPAELNEELFSKVYGEEVKTEAQFRDKIKEEAERMYAGESERMFQNDVAELLMKNTKIELPKAFLIKWLEQAGEKQMSHDEAHAEFHRTEDGLRWQLIENRIIRDNNIQVTQEELMEQAKSAVRGQLAQFGQVSPEEKDVEQIAQRVLSNQEEAQKLNDQMYSKKMLDFYRENLKVTEKEVTLDEFIKLVNKQ